MLWSVVPAPKCGDKRTVRRFAWLPVRCEGNVVVWLEHYAAKQVYYRGDEGYVWETKTRRARETLV